MSETLATDMQTALLDDTDDVAPGRQVVPADSPELFALLYYLAAGLISHRQATAAPASPTSAGEPGQLYHDAASGWLYICVSDAAWVRVAVSASW